MSDGAPPVVFALGRTDPLRGEGVKLRPFTDLVALGAAVDEARPAAVVLEHDPDGPDGLAALGALGERHPAVPTLLWTETPDGTVAAAATRRGVTEYASAAADSLPDRVRAVATDTQLGGGAAVVAGDDRNDAPDGADIATDGADAVSPGAPTSVGDPPHLLERIDDGFVAIDEEWRFTHVDERAETMLGEAADGLVGRDAREFLPEHLHEPFARAMRTGEAVTLEGWFDSLDARLLVSISPDGDGLHVYARDTSEERRYRRALSTLLERTSDLMVAETETEVARTTVDAAAEIIGFELNGVRRYDPTTGALELLCATEEARSHIAPPESVATGEGLQGKAFATGETIVVDDPGGDAEGRYDGVRAAATVPLGEYGTLTVGSRDVGGVDGVDRDLLELLGLSAEAALLRAEREASLREYRAVHETVDQMVYTLDETGHISLLTAPMAERFGYRREELVGEHIREILPPGDVDRGRELIAELLSEPPGDSRTYETRVYPNEGDPFPVEVDITLFRRDGEFRGSVGVVRDVSELHRARAELADERDRFAYLFEQLPDAVVEAELVDGEPVVSAVNEAFERVFGFEAETVVGELLNEFVVPSSEAGNAERIDERSRRGEVVREEVRRQTATGTREFLCTGVPFDTEGERTRGFAIYTDITEQRDRERRLQVLYRVLRHNLRNDMNVISGNAADLHEALADSQPRLAALADTIYERATQVADISHKAGDIQRAMDTDSVPYGVELDRVVRQAVDRVGRHHPSADVRVDVPAIPVESTGGLVRAVENLVENGVVHAGDTDPTVRVTVDTDAPEGFVDLRVADDGPGIPAREKAVLVDDDDITQLRHSRGLGLWTVRWVVEASGGELWFDERETGAMVVIRLRRAGVSADEE
ncbi:PAS domain S-box protein [Salinirubellus salinus]|uniref:histidine kinase n=1 Tax=Salinirubellus salinus TaxID=1364945 RepID=A0A9E7U5Z2_9EURY|nr:PAS domain S-box protein [Salinirubellus salinus]UWM55935.1 PAS domain S-box protein [Salinirubellus salinus]